MNFGLVGPGQLGKMIFQTAVWPRLVVQQVDSDCKDIEELAELGVTNQLENARVCQIVAVAVPANACYKVFLDLCPHMAPGSILLNFSTGWDIPERLKKEFPSLHLLELKLIGSAIGMGLGLRGLAVLNCEDQVVVNQIRSCLPGLAIFSGDSGVVCSINTLATRVALQAAITLEEELSSLKIPKEMTNAAIQGLMPGVLVSYVQGTLGGFARGIEADLRGN